MIKYTPFKDPITHRPMVRIYQQRLARPVAGVLTDTVTVPIESGSLHGEIKEIDEVQVVLALC